MAAKKEKDQETCKGDFKVTAEKSKIEQIHTLAYVVALMHSHKSLMVGFMADDAMRLAKKCMDAALLLASTLEVEG